MGLLTAKIALIRMWRHPRYFLNLIERKLRFKRRYAWVRSHLGEEPAPRPLIYKFMLNQRCNLHCSMCMLWGPTGFAKEEDERLQRAELPYAIIEKVIRESAPDRPSFIFTGGEPFLYPHIDDIIRALKAKRTYGIILTNGTLLEGHIEEFEGNPWATLLISLDGTKDVNDVIRGEGVHDKVLANIKRLKALKKPPFIGIQFTIRPENAGDIHGFCREMADAGVDWVLLNPTWFITSDEGKAYEEYMMENFGVEAKTHLGYSKSFDLDIGEFKRQYQKVLDNDWSMQISCYIPDPLRLMQTYVESGEVFSDPHLCLKQWLRMDINQEGKIAPCIQFPDLVFGDLGAQSIDEAWNGAEYADFRKKMLRCHPPICRKCNNVYLYNAGRRSL